MITWLIVSIANGVLFGLFDGAINANPLAQKLFEVYKPISRASINVTAGILIDIGYGLVMGFLFLMLYKALPGDSGWTKGLVFGGIIWFFRALMGAVSSWMMYTIPVSALLYSAGAGLVEMLIIGLVFGIFLKPAGA